MSKILISYRREDSADITGRIYDRLVQQFGRGAVFQDVDSIPFGVDFRTYLDQQVDKCDVFLAVIGRNWTKGKGRKGKSRLDDTRDFVRIEIEAALKRDIPVIPVLVGGASIPPADQLPASIQDLSYRHGIVVRPDPDFHRDMDRLIQYLKQPIKGTKEERKEPNVVVRTNDEGRRESTLPRPDEIPSRVRAESSQPPITQSSSPRAEVRPGDAPANMVKVPKGPFLYGDKKARGVIDYDYWIDQYPVTNEKYRAFIKAGGYGNQAYWSPEGWKWKTKHNVTCPECWDDPQWNKPDHPVVGVSYYEAEAYAKWAGKRLPTEQEWEKAARGEDGRQYPWGEEFDEKRCNSHMSGYKHTTSMTRYPEGVSPYGCYDMAGNVWEWCVEEAGQSLLRGGAWNVKPEYLRTYYRNWSSAEYRNLNIGCRLAQDIGP